MASTPEPRIQDLTDATARSIAEAAGNGGPVLSVYLDLDPTEFATPPARSSAIGSLVDDARRQIESADLGHDGQKHAREDLDRVRRLLEGPSLPSEGARAVAVFSSSASGLFEVVKLGRPAPSRAVLDDSPWVEPLVEAAPGGRWCVLLVNRSTGRILLGDERRLIEATRIESDVHGRHDQGGWSQRRFERGVEREVDWHIEATLEELFTRFRRRPFDCLLVGGPGETVAAVERALHPYLRERLAGRVEIDVENTNPDEVRRATAPVIEEHEKSTEREALDRLQEGVGRAGRGVAGLGDVLGALNEQRVEILLLEENHDAPGVSCPACGWLGPEGVADCPADGTTLEQRGDITGRMIEKALEQAAAVRVVRHHPDLGPLGGVGAVTRF